VLDFFVMPKSYIKNAYDLDVQKIAEEGYRLLICDIDNTLVAFHEQKPTEQAQNFLDECKAAGLTVVICSNNVKERVKPFADAGGCDCVWFFCKPFPWNYIKLKRKYKFKSKQTLCVGDQLLTDVLGANLMGFHSVFCDPLHDFDSSHTKFSRFLERYVLGWLTFRKKWRKGEYYGYQVQRMRY